MKYHLVLSRPVDLDSIGREAAAGKRPRHAFGMLRDRLGATVHVPGSDPVTAWDRARGKLFGDASFWAMARRLARELGPDDVIFCSGEDVAIPVAAVCGSRRDRPKVALFAHNLDRPRAKVAIRLFGIGRKVDLFVTNIAIQVDFLRRYLGLPESRVRLIEDQTDRRFFAPGDPSPGKARPVVASVGLEQRDYRTLAEATAGMDVDVRISGFSTDAALQARALPDVLPPNMTQRFYEWPELAQLYRDADVVAVSLFECKYSAGITTIMEGLAAGRPVVVTRTEGVAHFLDPDAMRITRPGDAEGLRAAIAGLLADPEAARAMADRGYALGRRHDSDEFVEVIARLLAGL